MASKRTKVSLVRLLLVNLVSTLALIEILIACGLHFPDMLRRLPTGISSIIENTYQWSVAPFVHLEDSCAQFDKTLGYKFRPGECTFSGYEFTTKVKVNGMGLRDDEESLVKPEIIVLGDSFAFGWGVEGAESFPEVLENILGVKVLNAAIPSYGTVRELLLLQQLDWSGVKLVILQYTENDFEENLALQGLGTAVPVMAQDFYENIKQQYRRSRLYLPGKYAVHLFVTLGKNFLERIRPATIQFGSARYLQSEAEAFIKVFSTRDNLLTKQNIPVLILDLPTSHTLGQRIEFTNRIKRWAEEHHKGTNSAKQPMITILDASSWLSESDYFILDTHLNRHGHQVIAQRIAELIRPYVFQHSSLPK